MAKFKTVIFETGCLIAGSCLCSVSVNMFAAPNHITQGGLTGVALILSEFFPSFPVGTAIFLMNVPLFIFSKIFLQRGFLSKTIINTAVFTLIIDLGSVILVPYTGDRLLASFFCGILAGTGLALVFLNGGTTGGTDIIAMLVRRFFKKLPVGRIMLFLDLAVLFVSYVVYGEIEAVLYASLSMFLSARAIDRLLYGSGYGKLLFIITEKGDKIKERLFNDLRRGVTTLSASGGYTGDSKQLLLCAVRSGEIKNISHIIASCDEKAFTVICDAGEISGEGFN